jgi:predicted TIM-barrel fold metal-dependent hydrolase
VRHFVDPHHHLWNEGGAPNAADPAAYSAVDFLTDVDTQYLVASVYIECGAMYRPHGSPELRVAGETEFAALAGRNSGNDSLCAGIVASADLSNPRSLDRVLDEHTRVAGGRLRGIRHTGAWDASPRIPDGRVRPPAHLYLDEDFRSGIAKLAARGLSFDAWVYHPQLSDVERLAARYPDLTLVVDHCGGPLAVGPYANDPAAAFRDWETGIRSLAERPNVLIKIGGLGMGIGPLHGLPWMDDPNQLAQIIRPYVYTCLDAFGPDRSMLESNFPMDKGAYGYATIWRAFGELTADLSENERDNLFVGTAARVYALDATTAQ